MRRADHRREVAAKIPRVADIGRDHLEEVAARLAAVVDPQRRDADALLPDIRRGRVVGAVRRAADIALMRPVDRPEARPPISIGVLEDRDERGQVRQMIAAVIGVVEQEHIAGMDVVAKELGHRFRRKGQRADMDRHVLGLGDQPASRSQIAVEKSRLELRICE